MASSGKDFGGAPAKATLQLRPFQAHVSDAALNDFHQCLKWSRLGPKTYENLTSNVKDYRHWGITRDWLSDMKTAWETKYDWRKTEDRINSFPNYTVTVPDSGFDFEIHFIALFSQKADAAPLLLNHGWPGSVLEFLDVLDEMRNKYSPQDLPFHVIVPSLPGYGYSNGPPLDQDWDTEGVARVLDKFMVGLGFGDGYISQGGDIGSFISRILGVSHESCKAVHLNLCIGVDESKDIPVESLSAPDQHGVKRQMDFGELGNAYAREHGTRPATIGLVLSSSPLALLAWIGEKFQQWTEKTPSVQSMLDGATLYWFTDSFPRAIFPYRTFFGPKPSFYHNDPQWYIKKPTGYSWHPEELAPVPIPWVAKTCNLVWSRQHTEGGHFAAWEKPQLFVKDMEDFVKDVWPNASKS